MGKPRSRAREQRRRHALERQPDAEAQRATPADSSESTSARWTPALPRSRTPVVSMTQSRASHRSGSSTSTAWAPRTSRATASVAPLSCTSPNASSASRSPRHSRGLAESAMDVAPGATVRRASLRPARALVDARIHAARFGHPTVVARPARAETAPHRTTEEEPTVDVLAAVAAEEPAMLDLLSALVAAPTLLGDEALGQAVMRAAFRDAGLEPFDVPLDTAAVAAHPAGAPHSWDSDGKANVLATWESAAPADGRSLILCGHVDVVSPEPVSLWSAPPFTPRRDGEWLQGRGAGDMKAGLAAMVGAVRGLRRLGLAPRAAVQLQSVVEEECTGNGALACVLAGHTPTPRSSRSHGRRGVARPGGRAVVPSPRDRAPAHAGDAAEGANAIEASAAIIAALRGLEAELNAVRPPLYAAHPHPINLNVGVIRGGDWPSTVAAECLTHFRLALYPARRWPTSRPASSTPSRRRSRALRPRRYRVEVRYDGFQCEGYELAPDAPLVPACSTPPRARRAPPAGARLHGDDGRADLPPPRRHPAVSFGPVAENAHGVDERVHLPSMVATAQALALFVADWCGVARVTAVSTNPAPGFSSRTVEERVGTRAWR